ncbi:MAG: 1-deoxy-D-xylulose-5-phosphate synthase [Treponema sp.]|nr:1-deoxy-D-xylulose-5-phosphate synthase [Treponema sp.]
MPKHEPLLPHIQSPRDLKGLDNAALSRLAGEIREAIVATVSRNGGHLASNLGVVELTIALHLVFNSPDDKIVWDVGHQCYAHKLLTGRYGSFPALRTSGGIAGFPKTAESPHDSFNTGHASTSISAALGILAAEKRLGTANRAAAVIGDGALTGGLAYEALSHAGQLELPLVVILNDNNMSIGPNVGALSKYLSGLSMKANYQTFRRAVDTVVKKTPGIGEVLFKIMLRLKRAVKAVFYTDNFFVDLGFEYVGPIEGHNIPLLVRVIRDAKQLSKPVVIHVTTQKGKGFRLAEDDPGSYHGVSAFSPAEGTGARTFTHVFAETILEAARHDERVVAITAAMEDGTGLSPFRKAFPERFFDVGIAEEHAVTFAAGLAVRGLRPVVAVYSTFIQRAADQIIHDVCLQNLPVIFALDRGGLVSCDGETHQGIFDISLFRPAPNLTILAPAGEEEFALMFQWAIAQPSAVMIRYPKASCPTVPAFSLPVEKGKGVWLKKPPETAGGKNVCVAFTGSLYPQVLAAAAILERGGITAALYNLRFLKPVDEDFLADIMNRYDLVVFAEEGRKSGGFGEYACELALRRNCSCKVLVLGIGETFDALGQREELLARTGLDGEGIAAAVAVAAGV